MKKYVAIYLLFFLVALPFYAWNREYKVFDTSNGLSDNTVKCITQDSLGFIWMGTFNGLCRFDGKEFVTYKHNPTDENSIANNHIEAILAAGADLWIGTDSGLNRYSFEEDRFYPCYVQTVDGEKRLSAPIRKIIDCDGKILVCTNTGELWAHKEGNLFISIDLGKILTYLTIASYKDHHFWAYTTDGLYLLNAQKGTIVSWLPLANSSVFNYDLYNMYYSPIAEMLFVGAGIGYKGEAFKITSTGNIERWNDFIVSDIKATIDYKGKILFGTDGGGLVEWTNGKFTQLVPQNSSISSDAVHALFVDREERLWIGTYRGGLNLYCPSFDWFHVLNMAMVRCHTIWSLRFVPRRIKSTLVWTEVDSMFMIEPPDRLLYILVRIATLAGTMSCLCALMTDTFGWVSMKKVCAVILVSIILLNSMIFPKSVIIMLPIKFGHYVKIATG